MNQITIRASSLGSLFDCPASWYAKHIERIQMPRSPRSLIGNAVHHAAAAYDVSRMNKSGLTINEAAGAAVDYIKQYTTEVAWEGFTQKDVESKSIELHQTYCAKIAPNYDFVAVEVKCEPITIKVGNLAITLTGEMDRIYQSFDGGMGGMDLKTGQNAVSKDGEVATAEHIPQMGVYTVLAESHYDIELTEPFAIAGLSTTNGQAGVGLIPNAKAALLGNPETEEKGLIHYAGSIIESGNFYGNPRSMICNKQYCPIFNRCKFRGK
ncbi:putative PD-(D/E)XK nuclease superfamily protein [Vitreoscilla sp. C1]|uniref:RecB family exonuclease n=1 Tax=Vitreoscilla sp. (strain C1) TaxID=96942 RepID=UPI000CDBE381|nr:PD-(D/E)XK nuclease family protein [Vitreoscilla sp. C1]AUZ05327.1 putative PD-(D/E)XK nuclease superfamily protein [Vitreoscilla sp. C1]